MQPISSSNLILNSDYDVGVSSSSNQRMVNEGDDELRMECGICKCWIPDTLLEDHIMAHEMQDSLVDDDPMSQTVNSVVQQQITSNSNKQSNSYQSTSVLTTRDVNIPPGAFVRSGQLPSYYLREYYRLVSQRPYQLWPFVFKRSTGNDSICHCSDATRSSSIIRDSDEYECLLNRRILQGSEVPTAVPRRSINLSRQLEQNRGMQTMSALSSSGTTFSNPSFCSSSRTQIISTGTTTTATPTTTITSLSVITSSTNDFIRQNITTTAFNNLGNTDSYLMNHHDVNDNDGNVRHCEERWESSVSSLPSHTGANLTTVGSEAEIMMDSRISGEGATLNLRTSATPVSSNGRHFSRSSSSISPLIGGQETGNGSFTSTNRADFRSYYSVTSPNRIGECVSPRIIQSCDSGVTSLYPTYGQIALNDNWHRFELSNTRSNNGRGSTIEASDRTVSESEFMRLLRDGRFETPPNSQINFSSNRQSLESENDYPISRRWISQQEWEVENQRSRRISNARRYSRNSFTETSRSIDLADNPWNYNLFSGTPRREDRMQLQLLSRLPIAVVESQSHDSFDDGRICPICLDNYSTGDIQRRLPCAHVYHRQCIDSWFSRSLLCPVCKHDATEEVTTSRS